MLVAELGEIGGEGVGCMRNEIGRRGQKGGRFCFICESLALFFKNFALFNGQILKGLGWTIIK